jgi:hypothetical protein
VFGKDYTDDIGRAHEAGAEMDRTDLAAIYREPRAARHPAEKEADARIEKSYREHLY